MNEVFQRAMQAVFQELTILLVAIEANLDLLNYLMRDVLSGEDSDLFPDDEAFANAVDEVLYCSALSAVDCLSTLKDQVQLLSPDDQEKLIATTGRYDELAERWMALVEAVHHVWQLRHPPQ